MSKLYIEFLRPRLSLGLTCTPRATLLIFLLRLALWFLTESLASRAVVGHRVMVACPKSSIRIEQVDEVGFAESESGNEQIKR